MSKKTTYNLLKNQALIIKKWRCSDAYTWRAVARRAAEEWPEKNILAGNQLDGMGLCEDAAKMLGENYMKSPWN